MTDTTKYLWDEKDKCVKKLEIPESSEVGLGKVHAEHLKKEALKKSKRGFKNVKNRS